MYRHRWLAVTVLSVVVIGAAVYLYRAVPVYEARVSVLIDYDEPERRQF